MPFKLQLSQPRASLWGTCRTSCRQVLQSLVDVLNDRSDLQAGIDRLMRANEMVDELNAIHRLPDLARLILQPSVAAMVNTQRVETIDGELRRPAVGGN